MRKLVDLISDMESKPGMYFTNYSIYSIKSFIDGFVLNNEDGAVLMYDFQVYVKNKYELSPVLSWDKMIRLYSNSDKDSMDLFFIIFREFLKDRVS